MSIMAGIQSQILEVTVVGCQNLKNTEWISRQDPYVFLEYNGARHRTRTCKDGGKNAVFQEKFRYNLIEGLRDVTVAVWNSNTFSTDDFIGNATIPLQKVLSQGYDDCTWTLQTKTGRFAGEIRLILHYEGANKHNHGLAPSAPYTPPQMPQYTGLSLYPQPSGYPPASTYPPQMPQYTGQSIYPQVQEYTQPSGYPPVSTYPPQSTSAYPPSYPHPPPPSSSYPPAPYPPQQPSYYPQPQAPYPGPYPPRPY